MKAMRKNRIPDDWTIRKVSQVFDFLSTNSFSRNQMNYEEKEGSIYNIHYGDIHATYSEPILDLEKCKDVPVINEDVVIPTSPSFLKDGDLVMADASEDYAGVGETVELTHLKNKRVLAGLHTFALRDKSDATVKGFRTYIFKHPKVATSVKVIATGSKVYGISKTNLANVKVILPPLPEQQKIATILSTWDKAIDKLTQLIAAKEQRKKGLMQQLLTGKKRFTGFTDEWREVKLGELAEIDKNSLKSNTDPKYFFKYISLSDVNKGTIYENLTEYNFSNSPSRAKRIVKTNSVIMATVRPNLQAFALVKDSKDIIVSTGFAVIDHKENLSPYYLIQYLFSKHITNQLEALIVGTNYPAINSSDVRNLKLKLPDIQEQQKIASVLSAADKEIELLKNELETLRQQKKGLMQVLLTGEKRIQ
jgi:type I restriction enzyme S subunit